MSAVINDTLRGTPQGRVMAGGLGNDTYYLISYKDQIVEHANAGTDTVTSYLPSYTLGDNLENLTLGGAALLGVGNALDNIMRATAPGETLNGMGGDDLLSGNVATKFIVAAGNGNDTIVNWHSSDIIRLDYSLSTFDQVRTTMRQVGADTQLVFANGERLVLSGVKASTLTADNFQLSIDTSQFRQTFADEFDSLSLYSSKTKTGTWGTDFSLVGTRNMVGHTMTGMDSVFVDPAFAGRGSKALGIDPFSLQDGVLSITTAPTPIDALKFVDNRGYTGGVLTTRGSFAQEYGYFEIRAAMSAGKGLYSAFWMLPADGSWPPELDIFEALGRDPRTIYTTVHDNVRGADVFKTVTSLIDFTQMHVYGVNWGPKSTKLYIDGIEVAEMVTPPSMNKEMYMLAHVGTGLAGGWIGGTDATTGTGSLKIDYIRAYRTADTVSTTINGVHTVYDPGSFTPGSGSPPPPPPVTVKAVDDAGFATAYGTPLAIAKATLLANDTTTGSDALDVLDLANPQHGAVTLVNGLIQFAPEAGFSGTASFDYVLSDGAGHLDRATVFVAVGAEQKPASTYIHGTVGTDVIDKSASSFGWMINASDGHDTILGGRGANALGGGNGDDVIVGGASADIIAGGSGADTMTGGAGNDTFLFAAGDLTSIASGKVDRITDFHPNGTGSERDVLRFTGFGAGASLSAVSANADGSFLYHVDAGVKSGDLIIHSGGNPLRAADYIFA